MLPVCFRLLARLRLACWRDGGRVVSARSAGGSGRVHRRIQGSGCRLCNEGSRLVCPRKSGSGRGHTVNEGSDSISPRKSGSDSIHPCNEGSGFVRPCNKGSGCGHPGAFSALECPGGEPTLRRWPKSEPGSLPMPRRRTLDPADLRNPNPKARRQPEEEPESPPMACR